MNVFIHEYFSGGGLALGADAGAAPVNEGVAMLRAALRDFGAVDGVNAYAIVDHRFAGLFSDHTGVTFIGEGYRERLEKALGQCDAALVIAPETSGILDNLTRSILSRGVLGLGCEPAAIRATGDKLAFASIMERAGVPHPKTRRFAHRGVWPRRGGWVVKPVDGVGSDGVWTGSARDLDTMAPGDGLVIQEFVEGDPMSLCVVSNERDSVILSVNRQSMTPGPRLEYRGGEITSVEPDGRLEDIVNGIHKQIRGLRGFWGMDYIQTERGPVVIEVNPRLTTSYCALADALDTNPAKLILNAVRNVGLPAAFRRRRVAFTTAGAAVS